MGGGVENEREGYTDLACADVMTGVPERMPSTTCASQASDATQARSPPCTALQFCSESRRMIAAQLRNSADDLVPVPRQLSVHCSACACACTISLQTRHTPTIPHPTQDSKTLARSRRCSRCSRPRLARRAAVSWSLEYDVKVTHRAEGYRR